MDQQDRKFAEQFEKQVRNTLRKHKLLSKKDRVLVACSGGKDSTSVLYLLNKFGYRAEGLIIDLQMGEWSEQNLRNLREFCKKQGLKLHTVSLKREFNFDINRIRSRLKGRKDLTPCLVCGVMKRWVLNRKARELGAAKIATGHNLDDEAQTCIMNLVNGNPKLGINMGPRTGLVEDPGFVPRVKPLFFTLERDSRRYSELMGFPVLYKRCPYAREGQRWKLRDFLDGLEKSRPGTKRDIVDSTLRVFREIRKEIRLGQVKRCRECGEPSRSQTCKVCQVLGAQKQPKSGRQQLL